MSRLIGENKLDNNRDVNMSVVSFSFYVTFFRRYARKIHKIRREKRYVLDQYGSQTVRV